MVYKWCVVPQCANTSIKTPHKVFLSVPTNPKRRRMWLKLARRDPQSIVSHSNVFICEDHFDMEKDTINYMKYKMGFSQKILLADDAMPTKFNCQADRKKRLTDAGSSRELFKQQRIDLVTDCLQSQRVTETLQKHANMIQEIIKPEEFPKSQDISTMTDPVITVEKSVQVTTKINMHYRSKAVQTRCRSKSISTSPLKISTSHFTSPFKIEPCCLQPSQSGVVKAVKRNIFLEDEKSESDISFFESCKPFVASSSSENTDSDSTVTDTNESVGQFHCLKSTMHLINKKPLMYVGITKECYFLIQLLHQHTHIKIEHILLCLKKIRLNSTFSELEDNFGISLSYASKLFLENIPIINSFLRQLL